MSVRSAQRSSDTLTQVRGWRRFALPSIGDVVFITIFTVALALGANLTQRDGDLAKHLRLGRAIIEDGQFPTIDVYSHTMAGGEMVPHEWLAQTALAAIERSFGFDGIGLLTAILVALPWLIMYRWLVRRGTPLGPSVGLVALWAAASLMLWAARPHIFTWLFVVLWVILLEDLRRGHRHRVWILVPLGLVWVNTHGSFVVGLVLMGIYLVGGIGDRYRQGSAGNADSSSHLLYVLLATSAVSFINPAGYRTVLHPFSHIFGDDFLFGFTTEFNSPDFHNPLFWPFLVMILLSIVLAFRWSITTLLLTVFWTTAGLYAFRHIPLYALVMTPLLAGALGSVWPFHGQGKLTERLSEYATIEARMIGGSLSLILIAFAVLSMARSPGSGFEFSSGFFPIEAIEAVGDDPPGDRAFHQFVWGGYLVYCCQPDIPVFIDGQTDYYGPELAEEYDETIRGMPSWREVFDKYDIDWVLIPPNTGLAQVLTEADDWEESYRDDTSLVFVPTTK